MKKYIVIDKSINKELGTVKTKKDAIKCIKDYLDILSFDDVINSQSGLKFEIKVKKIEEITKYEDACKFLGYNERNEGRHMWVTNNKHYDVLSVLKELFALAEAWNKQDGFTPNLKGSSRYYPIFSLNEAAGVFFCNGAIWTNKIGNSPTDALICFKTSDRAEDFGKKFIKLYNALLLSRE